MNKQKTFTNKTLIVSILILCVVVFFTWTNYQASKKQTTTGATSYKDISYVFSGNRITLTNGKSEIEQAPGSASKIVTNYFGNELQKDLNGDGKDDVIFLLTQTTGGSGVFYYAAAAIITDNGYVGSEAVLLGDRIAPQSTESGPGNSIIVNFADRKPLDSFEVQPYIAKSMRLLFDPVKMQFGELVQNFEGESNR